jgi:hypothetical protein
LSFTANVSRGTWPHDTGSIDVVPKSERLDVSSQMQIWNSTKCQQVRVQPLKDLILRDTWLEPLPRPKPDTPETDPCGYLKAGSKAWIRCQAWYWGMVDFPEPNYVP